MGLSAKPHLPSPGVPPASGAGQPGPIEDYALLSDLRTAALVGKDGSIDWLCVPHFDSPSCFSRLLADDRAGHWRIAPVEEVQEVRRRYREDTMVLETDFHTVHGVVRLIDAMEPHPGDQELPMRLIRKVQCISGSVQMRLDWVVRFAYADSVPWVRRVQEPDSEECIFAVAGPDSVVLRGEPLPRPVGDRRAHEAIFTIGAGESRAWVMQYTWSAEDPPGWVDPGECLRNTEEFWRDWTSRILYRGPHETAVRRSLITLKGLIYAPSGGIVAAPTTSLPEALGGARNWDYRYCWLRDATLTLLALDSLGCSAEAESWRDWLLRAVAGDPADLQIMYGIDGRRHLLEWHPEWLTGYQGAQPVRIGNDAFRQRQLDVYGEVMDALQLARERGLAETTASWALQRALLHDLERIWQLPDRGLWEVRGPERYFTHSRVMVWVAFDRAVRAIQQFDLPGPVQRWRELRDQVHAEVLEHGWNEQVGAFTQYYGGTELDAATLLLPTLGFLPGTDERIVRTIEAIDRKLRHGDLVDRYSTEPGISPVDGLSGSEGSFIACSFWLVDALVHAGRREDALAMFTRLVDSANDVGLYSEEFDAETQRFTGNFPQAFSHLAMVDSAALLALEGFGRHGHDRRGRSRHRHAHRHGRGLGD
ncbi:glycoside hydrolase family 15 protein [Actinoalloteichus hymeniacidonis]|uniref:Glycosyl hydrolase, glucoamylase n=1 Tax=Actinoalloteichus hymeniacidonis TaxID=340345 RepID=A0AAC9HUR0_9PSEU|nr:glycoside hydrolase family 15 protein [Actinoalloteichus hymeniacidonis]AOS65974.1 glycosyl hydrolase, glucoamylase [Actinoalloteichus hymeniacidonis]MBB5905926.1 glucoamylase [Actinoalloteichus hymeniacidonis]